MEKEQINNPSSLIEKWFPEKSIIKTVVSGIAVHFSFIFSFLLSGYINVLISEDIKISIFSTMTLSGTRIFKCDYPVLYRVVYKVSSSSRVGTTIHANLNFDVTLPLPNYGEIWDYNYANIEDSQSRLHSMSHGFVSKLTV